LLVEDSEDEVVVVHRLAEATGLKVNLLVFRDGEAALDFLTQQSVTSGPPDLPQFVLLDLSLPRMGGIEILRRMRSESILADIPVIILSGTQRVEEIREGQDLKAHTHIVKPMSSTEFSWIVRSIENYWPRLERLRTLELAR
jgi:two-component system response regulator